MNEELLRFPVAQRRGVAAESDEDQFNATLIEGNMDQVLAGLNSNSDVCHIESDVLADYCNGQLLAPTGNYAVLFQIEGTDWVHYSGAVSDDVDQACGLRVLTLGHNDNSDYCHLSVHRGDKPEIEFSTIAYEWEEFQYDQPYGETDDDPRGREHYTKFNSDYHAADWWQQFKTPRDVQNELLRYLNAYVPLACARSSDGIIKLDAWHDDAIDPRHAIAVALVLYGKPRSIKPTAESHKLKQAIEKRDEHALRSAIAAGADLHYLPDSVASPLGKAITKEAYESQPTLTLIQTLLAAGADPNDGGDPKACDAPIFAAIGCSRNPRFSIELTKMLLDRGAHVNARSVDPLYTGATPLMIAAKSWSPSLAHLLLLYGADPGLTDHFSRTAADYTQWQPQGNAGRQLLKPDFAQRFAHQNLTLSPTAELPPQIDERVSQEEQVIAEINRQQQASKQQFKNRMDKLDAKMKQAEAELHRDVYQFLHQQPDQISLEPIDPIQWREPVGLGIVSALESLGFESVGDFQAAPVENFLLRGFANVDAGIYAAVCEITNPAGDYRHGTWVELIRFYDDGATDRISNSGIPECARYLQNDGHTNEHFPPFVRYTMKVDTYNSEVGHMEKKSGFELDPLEECTRMLNHLQQTQSATKTVLPVTHDDFAKRYREFYAQDTAFMKQMSKSELQQ